LRVGRKKTFDINELTDKTEKFWDTPKFRGSTMTLNKLEVSRMDESESGLAIVNMLDPIAL